MGKKRRMISSSKFKHSHTKIWKVMNTSERIENSSQIEMLKKAIENEEQLRPQEEVLEPTIFEEEETMSVFGEEIIREPEKIQVTEQPQIIEKPQQTTSLNKLRKLDLLKMARSLNCEGVSAKNTKAQLIAAIEKRSA